MARDFESDNGIWNWASNITTKLAADPTRPSFKDAVQTRGIAWLKDYMDSVRSGSLKLHEITKTPARRKASPQKTRAVTVAASVKKAKLAGLNDKENQPVLTTAETVHQQLLKAQEEKKIGADDDDEPTQLRRRAPLSISIALPTSPHLQADAFFNPPALAQVTSPARAPLAPHNHAIEIIEEMEEVEEVLAIPEEETGCSLGLVDDLCQEPGAPQPFLEAVPHVSGPEGPLAPRDEPVRPAQQSIPPLVVPANPPVASPQRNLDVLPAPPSVKPFSALPPAQEPPIPERKKPEQLVLPTSPICKAGPPTPRSPTPSKIPRSPRSKHTGSAPLAIVPRSPLQLRQDLGLSDDRNPRTQPFALPTTTPAPRPTLQNVNAMGGPKIRSSFLERNLPRVKESMGVARPSGLDVDDAKGLPRPTRLLKGSLQATVAPSAAAGNSLKRKSEVEEHDGGYVDSQEADGRKMKMFKSQHEVEKLLEGAHQDILVHVERETQDDDTQRSLNSLMRNIDASKSTTDRIRGKSIVDIDVTSRFNYNLPPLRPYPTEPILTTPTTPPEISAASVHPSPVAPTRAQPPSRQGSGAYDRLSISELTSSIEHKAKPAPAIAKKAEPKEWMDRAIPAPAMTRSSFKLLNDSVVSTTTPPHSPPKSSAPSKPTVAAPVISTSLVRPPLSPREEMILGFAGPSIAPARQLAKSNESMPPPPLPTFGSPIAQVKALSRQPSVTALPPPPLLSKQIVAQPAALHALPPGAAPPVPKSFDFTDVPLDLFAAPLATVAKEVTMMEVAVAREQTFISVASTQETDLESIFSTQTMSTQPTLTQEYMETNVKGKGKEVARPVSFFDAPALAPASRAVQPKVVQPVLQKQASLDIASSQGGEDEEMSDDISSMGDTFDDTQTDGPPMSSMAGSFLNSAANYFGKAFGAGTSVKKAGKPEPIKAIESAAAIKKEQEEKEKKQARVKEKMDQRRMAASQKKAEDEKTRQADIERRKKEEADRRRKEREREEAMLAKNTYAAPKPKKPEDGPVPPKRKVTQEIVDTKPALKKQPSKDKMNVSYQAGVAGNTSRPNIRPAVPPPQPPAKTLVKKPSGQQLASAPGPSTGGPSFSKLPPAFGQPVASSSKAALRNVAGTSAAAVAIEVVKTKRAGPKDDDVVHPTMAVEAQMRARVEAQMAARTQAEMVASEQIELPDINSEYSNSDDEDRHKDHAEWTQSPVLAKRLEMQKDIDPDTIFGAVPPLEMEKIFTRRQGKWRTRTSSANWNGGDGLKEREKLEYARKMGFK